MPRFAITEVWTKLRVVDAPNISAAYDKSQPDTGPAKILGMRLSNWHALEVPDQPKESHADTEL